MLSKVLLLFFILLSTLLNAQTENQLLREGNKKFKDKKYDKAEIYYRRALEENPSNAKALYNLSNALYKQGRFDEAINILDGLSQMELDEIDKSNIYHNLGNAQLNAQQIKESIESYKNALRNNPEDEDTRYNLAYAKHLLEEQEQQQQDDGENGDDDQEQEEQEQEQEQQPEQDEQQPPPDQITQEDAERILDALNQQEQEIQEKINRDESETIRRTPEKEW